MSIRFKPIFRQLFHRVSQLSLVEKLLYICFFFFVLKLFLSWISQIINDFSKWISTTYKYFINYISQPHIQILLIAAIFGVALFAIGYILYIKRGGAKQSQLDDGLDDILFEESTVNQSKSIYTEGNYNENISGDYVEIHGNQININSDFSQFAEQIQELLEQLKDKGYSQENVEQEIINKLEEKQLNNPRIRQTLRRWIKTFSKNSNFVTDKEVTQEVVKTATSYSYTSSKDFTDVIGGDFHILNELLAAKKWEEADLETARIIYTVGQNKSLSSYSYKNYSPNSIIEEHIKVIPKKYLHNINKLWNKYSNGRFGFNVQKRIWGNICKKKQGQFYFSEYEAIDEFGSLVGWRKKDDDAWLYYVDLYDPNLVKTAASGHFPLLYMLRSDEGEKCEVDFDIFKVICERL